MLRHVYWERFRRAFVAEFLFGLPNPEDEGVINPSKHQLLLASQHGKKILRRVRLTRDEAIGS
jgi:hypothetical protein